MLSGSPTVNDIDWLRSYWHVYRHDGKWLWHAQAGGFGAGGNEPTREAAMAAAKRFIDDGRARLRLV